MDIMVDADARELQTLLVRLVKRRGVTQEVSRFHNVDGALSGRLVLGKLLTRFQRKFGRATSTDCYLCGSAVCRFAKGCRFNYDNGKIEAEGLEGRSATLRSPGLPDRCALTARDS